MMAGNFNDNLEQTGLCLIYNWMLRGNKKQLFLLIAVNSEKWGENESTLKSSMS